MLEEFDGLNDEEACGLVLCVKLPLLARGHAIQVHTLSKEFVQVSVTNLYHLALALPFKVEGAVSFFDCKIRRLFIHVTKQKAAMVIDEPEADDGIEEIDTDVVFERGATGKVQGADAKEPPADDDNDMLYDLC